MKSVTAALASYINTARGNLDVPLYFAECFLITLATGTVLSWTNADYAVAYNGYTFSCAGPLIQGLKYKSSVGLEVDKQQITIGARPTDLISGAQALVAIRSGGFDGAIIERHRVFLTAPAGAVIGGVMLFHGRVSTVDNVGRTSAQMTVASDLVILDYDMPRNLFSPSCIHSVYDAGCGVNRSLFAANGSVGAGSTTTVINTSGALAAHAQGSILFTSGANANVRATVRAAAAGVSLLLMYPLPNTPATGDAFTVWMGCDHSQAACASRFNSVASFRAFPFVPAPDIAY